MTATRNTPMPQAAGPAPADVAEMQRRARGAELTHRLMSLHELLVNGTSPEEAVAQAQLQWRISRRQALRYLYRIRKRLLDTGYREDRAYVQQMGLVQRGRVLGKLLGCLRELDPDEAPSIPLIGQLAGVAAKLIDARDRSAIAADTRDRDTAPDRPRVAHSSRTTQAIVMTARTHPALPGESAPPSAVTTAASPEKATVAVIARLAELAREKMRHAPSDA